MVLSKLLSAAPERSGGNQAAIRRRGFTLIEMVAVLVLLGILATVAVSRITGTQEAERNVEIAKLKNHLRYAQMRAMNSGGPEAPVIWGIQKVGGSGYRLFRRESDGTLTPFTLPGENQDTVTTQLLTWDGGFTVVGFDYFGRPSVNLTNFETPQSVPVTSGTNSITITQETGFIP